MVSCFIIMLVLFATQEGMRETEIRTLGAWCFHLLQNNSQNCLLLENIYIVGAVIYDFPKHVDIYLMQPPAKCLRLVVAH